MLVDKLQQILKAEYILDILFLKLRADDLIAIFINAIKTNPSKNLLENPIQQNNWQYLTRPRPAINIPRPVFATLVLAILVLATPVFLTLVSAIPVFAIPILMTLLLTTLVSAIPVPVTTDLTTTNIPCSALTTLA